MKMHYSHRLSSSRVAQVVGLFVLIPLLGMIVAGLFIVKAESLFEEKYVLHSTLTRSYGLEPGTPVLIAGIPVGRVEGVDFDGTAIKVSLKLLRKYQDKIREDSVASIGKSGLVMGQTQVEIAMGDPTKPLLRDGATLRAIEPKDYAALLGQVGPVLESVQRTLTRVEEISKDVQATVQTGGRVLANVEQATTSLPAVMASVQRTTGSLERTSASLPEVAASVKKTLAMVDGITADVKSVSRRLPDLVDTAHEAIENVRATTQTIRGVGKEVPQLMRAAHSTLDDVNVITRGAKKTFPISTMVKNAGAPSAPAENGIRSLRGDQLPQ
jgi:phospholipid/cholesterol/gamma-HCH transport system substrate-binding protein